MNKKITKLIFIFLAFLSMPNIKALTVEYKGKDTGLEIIENNIFENTEIVYPADVLNSEIEILNSSDEDTEIYLKIENSNSDNELLSKLNLKITNNNNEIIYEGNYIQEDYTSLGIITSQTTNKLNIELEIPNNIDNTYSLKEINTKWSFYIKDNNNYKEIVDIINPKTGDNITKNITILVLSLLLIIIILTILIRKEKYGK